MTTPRVTIRYGSAYPDAVLDHLEGEVVGAGLAAHLEPLPLDTAGDDTSAFLVVEVLEGDLLDDGPDADLDRGAFGAAWDAVLATALRRSRRQQAEGDRRDVVVALRLPGDVVVTAPGTGEGEATPLVAALRRRRAGGGLTAGVLLWDPQALRLQALPPQG